MINTVEAGAGAFSVTWAHSGKFIAVPNSNDNTVSIFQVDCETGTAIPLQTVTAGVAPVFASYAPCNSHAVVANSFCEFDNVGDFCGDTDDVPQGSLSVYNVNCESGTWSLIQTLSASNHPEINHPHTALYSPDGRFVAVASRGNGGPGQVSIFRVSQISGKLVFASTIDVGNGEPVSLDFSPDGKFLAVTLFALDQVLVFAVDPLSGQLSLIDTEVTGNPWGIAYQHNGRFAAVVNQAVPPQEGEVAIFAVNVVDGTFDNTDSGDIGLISFYVDFSRNDTVLAVGNYGTGANNGSVNLFCMNANDTPIPLATIPDLPGSRGVAFAPCGDFLAVSLFDSGELSIYKISDASCTN